MIRTPAISLKGVEKTYGDFQLGPVDLTIEPGHVVAVVGPNGAGKSTLFGMLMNLVRPDSGEVSLFGGSYPQDEVETKQKVGYVPERSVGHDDMNALALGEFVSRWYPGWDGRHYRELLRRSAVDQGKRFSELSKGMQRRLSFALALATGPELLLLDEPTVGVDPFARMEMLEDVSHFVRDGRLGYSNDVQKTVVFATHAVEEARRVADQMILLASGEFLGLYDKYALLAGWKTLWVDGRPEGNTPGVVEVEEGSPTRIISDSPQETAEALSAKSVRIIRSGRVDLEEILFHLVQRDGKRQRA